MAKTNPLFVSSRWIACDFLALPSRGTTALQLQLLSWGIDGSGQQRLIGSAALELDEDGRSVTLLIAASPYRLNLTSAMPVVKPGRSQV